MEEKRCRKGITMLVVLYMHDSSVAVLNNRISTPIRLFGVLLDIIPEIFRSLPGDR